MGGAIKKNQRESLIDLFQPKITKTPLFIIAFLILGQFLFFSCEEDSSSENTPPIINYTMLDPPYYECVAVELTEWGEEFLTFSINEIWDPDREEKMYGRFAIDYTGTGIATGRDFAVTRKNDGHGESDVLWEGSFRIDVSQYLIPGRCHRIVAVISDRAWDAAGYDFFAVPGETTAAYVMWIVAVYEGSNRPSCC